MKKKILALSLCGFMVLGITGCGKTNKGVEENVKKELTWQQEAKIKCVVDAMGSIRKFSKDYNNMFSNWYNDLKKCENNCFAKMIIDEVEKIGYNSWKQEEKDTFDIYILALFSVKNNEVQKQNE